MHGMMPTIFFGHGNPMNALLNNSYTEACRRIGENGSNASHASMTVQLSDEQEPSADPRRCGVDERPR